MAKALDLSGIELIVDETGGSPALRAKAHRAPVDVFARVPASQNLYGGKQIADELALRWNAHDRLVNALAGLIGLCQLVASRRDIEPDIAEALTTNHRRIEADAALRLAEPTP